MAKKSKRIHIPSGYRRMKVGDPFVTGTKWKMHDVPGWMLASGKPGRKLDEDDLTLGVFIVPKDAADLRSAMEVEVDRAIDSEADQLRGLPKGEFIQDGNDGEIIVDRSLHIHSIKDALEFVGLSPACEDRDADTEWLVTDSKFGFNDVHLNLKSVGKVVRVTNPNGWIKLRRRKLVPVKFEPLKPVVLTAPARKHRPYEKPVEGTVENHILIGDPQFGFFRDHVSDVLHTFHDRACLSIVMQLIEYECADSATCLGDYYDLPMFQQRFPRGPELFNLTQPALIEGGFFAMKVQKILDRNAEKKKRDTLNPFFIMEGNHDKRLKSALSENLAEAAMLRPILDPQGPPMLSIDRLMNADDLQVQFVGPYPEAVRYLNGNLGIVHGHKLGSRPGETPKKYLSGGARASFVYGHCHDAHELWLTTDGPEGQREVMAASPGCTCRTDGAVPGGSKRLNWQQGIAKVAVEIGGREFFQYRNIRIQGPRALHDGLVFESKEKEYKEELVEWVRSIGWPNWEVFAKSVSASGI